MIVALLSSPAHRRNSLRVAARFKIRPIGTQDPLCDQFANGARQKSLEVADSKGVFLQHTPTPGVFDKEFVFD